jgi:hypothetical protein
MSQALFLLEFRKKIFVGFSGLSCVKGARLDLIIPVLFGKTVPTN